MTLHITTLSQGTCNPELPLANKFYETFQLQKYLCTYCMYVYMTHTINANLKHTPSSGPFNCSSLQTVSIETGLQNGGVPFFMIQMALTSPDLELATIPIVYVSALTPVPMLTICLCYMLYNKVKAKVSLQNSLVYQILIFLSFTSILSGAHRYLSVLCKYFSPKTTFFSD